VTDEQYEMLHKEAVRLHRNAAGVDLDQSKDLTALYFLLASSIEPCPRIYLVTPQVLAITGEPSDLQHGYLSQSAAVGQPDQTYLALREIYKRFTLAGDPGEKSGLVGLACLPRIRVTRASPETMDLGFSWGWRFRPVPTPQQLESIAAYPHPNHTG